MKRSIVAICDIKKNCKINKNMIGFKRPFTGISPNEVNSVIEKKAKIFIKKNSQLKWSDIA